MSKLQQNSNICFQVMNYREWSRELALLPQQRYVQVSQKPCLTIILDYQPMLLNIELHWFYLNIVHHPPIFGNQEMSERHRKCLTTACPPQIDFFLAKYFQSSQKYYKGPRPVQTELFRGHFSSTLLGPNVHSNDPPFIALPRPALHWWPALLH